MTQLNELRLTEKLSYYDECKGLRNSNQTENLEFVKHLTNIGIIPSISVLLNKCIAIFDNRYQIKLFNHFSKYTQNFKMIIEMKFSCI